MPSRNPGSLEGKKTKGEGDPSERDLNSTDLCLLACLFLSLRTLLADPQLIYQELLHLKLCVPVERLKQDHAHLPHRGGTSRVGTAAVPLWRAVGRGT